MSRIITISREFGAGGHSIGTQVAEKLGIPFYDRDIVRATAKESGLEVEQIEKEEEDTTTNLLKSICAIPGSYYYDTQDEIHEIQRAIIINMARKGPCVILGRCADVILREAGMDSLNVFIHADDIHRAVRVSELTGSKNATEIQKIISKRDNSRHSYYHQHTSQKWGDSRNYHLTLDSGALGYDLCVKLIVEAAQAE